MNGYCSLLRADPGIALLGQAMGNRRRWRRKGVLPVAGEVGLEKEQDGDKAEDGAGEEPGVEETATPFFTPCRRGSPQKRRRIIQA